MKTKKPYVERSGSDRRAKSDRRKGADKNVVKLLEDYGLTDERVGKRRSGSHRRAA